MKIKNFIYFFLCNIVTLISITTVKAQVPDAGRLYEQIRPPLQLPETPPNVIPELHPIEAEGDGPRVLVKKLLLTGASIFSEQDLYALVKDSEGQELTLNQLHDVADRITQYYRQRGYVLARCYVPPQKVINGQIQLTVLEGKLGKLIENTHNIIGGAAFSPLDAVRFGDVARTQTLERSLLLLSDLPGVVITSTLKPGSLPGTSDLSLNVMPGPRLTGNIDLDGNGDRFSGRIRTGGALNINNPFKLGDQITLRGKRSDMGFYYASAEYRLPINRYGTQIGLGYSDLNYQLGNSLAPLGLQGELSASSAFLQHPVVRSRQMNINAKLQAENLKIKDQIIITETTIEKKINALSASLVGDWLDPWYGSANWLVEYTNGVVHLDPVMNEIDEESAKSAGRFGKWNFAFSRLQGLTQTTSFLISINGQFAEKNLDSSKKMSIGGANGVRAYPQGEGFGDEGYVASIELRRQMRVALPGYWQSMVFADHGHINVNKNNWTINQNTRSLSGAGIGVQALLPDKWSIKTMLAWRMGPEDKPRNDLDRLPRAWLQIMKAF
jgi:hemolysin activation/secretion protein